MPEMAVGEALAEMGQLEERAAMAVTICPWCYGLADWVATAALAVRQVPEGVAAEVGLRWALAFIPNQPWSHQSPTTISMTFLAGWEAQEDPAVMVELADQAVMGV
jgi:hypothetical protein